MDYQSNPKNAISQMKILYIISTATVNKNNGIKKQAEIWADGLSELGHSVVLFNPWQQPSWKDFDLIHIFGNGLWLLETIRSVSVYNIPIFVSPIIDSFKSIWMYRFASYVGIPFLRLYSTNFVLRFLKNRISCILVRSNHEYGYIKNAYRYSEDKIALLRLPCRISPASYQSVVPKEDFCFHLSAFTQKRKNVMRLMEAAAKYGFRLVIAGAKGTDEESAPFFEFAKQHPNIEIIGEVSEAELVSLYSRAKVFALPSIDEGVGFVALEAATFGCNIVITDIGGPKEYYNDMATTVNPFDIDDIGISIVKALASAPNENLRSWMISNYEIQQNCRILTEIYKTHK